MSWNFVKLHKILFQTDTESFNFLSWKTPREFQQMALCCPNFSGRFCIFSCLKMKLVFSSSDENLTTQPYLFVVSFGSSRVGSLKRPDPIILISIFFYLLVAIISSRWNSHIIFQNWEIYQLDTYQTLGRHSLILA